jgi:3-deoxy-D-manno-octulosonic-acid transferase
MLVAAQYGVKMALLNGRLSGDDVLAWHSKRVQRALLSDVLSKFDLIVPSSDLVRGRNPDTVSTPQSTF